MQHRANLHQDKVVAKHGLVAKHAAPTEPLVVELNSEGDRVERLRHAPMMQEASAGVDFQPVRIC